MGTNYGQGRTEKKSFKVNEDEANLIKKLSEPFGDEAKFIRYQLFENNIENNLSYEDKKEILQLLSIVRSEMSRVGGNLNQLARTFNQTGKVGFKKLEASHEDLRYQQTDLMNTLKSIIKMLS